MTITGALICFNTAPFSYIKTSVLISGICGCSSKWKILVKIITKMEGGEEIHLIYFTTQMKLYSECPNIGWKLVHKWIKIWFSTKIIWSYLVQRILFFLEKNNLRFVKIKFSKRTQSKNLNCWDFLRQTALLQPNL